MKKEHSKIASKAICHAPNSFRFRRLVLCVQKGVVILPASATLTGYLSQYPNIIIQL